jgi:hypothetical protein
MAEDETLSKNESPLILFDLPLIFPYQYGISQDINSRSMLITGVSDVYDLCSPIKQFHGF